MNAPLNQRAKTMSDDRLNELAPCPFCGWAVTEDEGLCSWDKDEFGDTVDKVTYTGVVCPGCSAFVPVNAHDKAEAIAAWNLRAASKAPPGHGPELAPTITGGFDMTTDERRPNPGSAEAVAAGCTCAVIDNHRGRGIPTKDGPTFWITEGCPVHAPSPQPPQGSTP